MDNAFCFQDRKKKLTIDIEGRVFELDISPSNYDTTKKIKALIKETMGLSDSLFSKITTTEDPAAKFDELEAAYEEARASCERIINGLYPGRWEELWELAGHDVLNVLDAIKYIGDLIGKALFDFKSEGEEPVGGGGERV
jgi:hypothetical protein